MKLGILGGTFDPIHRGHTFIAHRIRETFGLDQVLFMVSNLSPHKEKVHTTSPFHRHAMVVLELLYEESLCASLLELEHETPSYTITTLERLRADYPDDHLCFIAGSDSLKEIHLWRDYATLLSEYCFVFVQRSQYEADLEQLKIDEPARTTIKVVSVSDKPIIQTGQSFLINIEAPPISSTNIRRAIAAGQDPDPESISAPVIQYIRECRLYERNQSGSVENLRAH